MPRSQSLLLFALVALAGCDSADGSEEVVAFDTVLQSNEAFAPYDLAAFETFVLQRKADEAALLSRFPLAAGEFPQIDYTARSAIVLLVPGRTGTGVQVSITSVVREDEATDGAVGFRYHVRADVRGVEGGATTYPATVVTTPKLKAVELGSGVEEVPLAVSVSESP